MAGDGQSAPLLALVQEISRLSGVHAHQVLLFKKDSTDLIRRIALLTHLLEEIIDFNGDKESSDSSDWRSDLLLALHAAKRLLTVAYGFTSTTIFDGGAKKIAFLFQCVTYKLEKTLGKIPYDHFSISEEVKEQVQLVRTQLRRAAKRYGYSNPKITCSEKSTLDGKNDLLQSSKEIDNGASNKHECSVCIADRSTNYSVSSDASLSNDIDAGLQENSSIINAKEVNKQDVVAVPEDFLCPVSLELMWDPVIVATGQTYERA